MEKIRELIRKLKNLKNHEDHIEPETRKRIRMQILILVACFLLVVVLIFTMTAAWFTNVAKTSDLVFQTESWGVDESRIRLSESAISIAPGKSGIIPLSVDNSTETESLQIGVNISKIEVDEKDTLLMNTELQKRIFFYADAPKTYTFSETAEEGVTEKTETVSRVYLGSGAAENYTYTVLPGQTLTMSDLYYNDVPIKWEWVYDMLGYYFRGTIVPETAATETTEAVPAVISEEEYLRPIEYDYQQAAFDTVKDDEDDTDDTDYQQVQTIEGVSAEKFLEKLSENDGYEGTIGSPVVVETSLEGEIIYRLYYPVAVDDTGYGVWAYLCTLEEIEAGIAYDSLLAKQTESLEAAATIVITANSLPSQTKSVQSESEFRAALTDEAVDVVELTSDLTLTEPLILETGEKVVDLGGYCLDYTASAEKLQMISVKDGASLTLMNGALEGTAGTEAVVDSTALECIAGNVTLSGVSISGFEDGICIKDMEAESGDSVIQMTDCEIRVPDISVFLQGNGSKSEARTKLMIQNSTIISEKYIPIMGQGNEDRSGTELMIQNSTLEGYYAGIYHPQQKSSAIINECTITGNTGIAVKGGTVDIYNSKITGTGAVATDSAGAAGSGFMDTGDGVYVEACYDWSATVNIHGENTVVKSEKAYSTELYGVESKGPGRIYIYDGAYTKGTEGKGSANWNGIGTFEIYAGKFAEVSDNITRYDKTE